jgi:hypothetical protein
MSTFKDKIKSRPEKVLPICLDPALLSELAQARDDLASADAESGVNPSTAWKRADKRVRDLEQKVRDATEQFTFRALPRREWAALVGKHAPRKDYQTDKMLGYDADAVTYEAAVAGLVSPVLDDEDWDALDGSLSSGEWERIKNAVLVLNAGKVDIPF